MLLVLVPVGLITVVGLVVLWPSGTPSKAERAAAQYVPPGAGVISTNRTPEGGERNPQFEGAYHPLV